MEPMNDPVYDPPFWDNDIAAGILARHEGRHKRRIEEACREMRGHLATLTMHPDVQAASELRSMLGLVALNAHRIEDALKEMP